MNKALVLNLGWLGVAAGAFYAGQQLAPESDTETVTDVRTIVTPTLVGTKGSASERDAEAPGANESVSIDAPSWAFKAELGEREMEVAIKDVTSMSDPIERNLLFSQLLKKLTPENARAAWEAVKTSSTGWERGQNMGLLAYAWGQADGAAALAASDGADGFEGGIMKSAALGGWAASDPEAAIEWLDGQEGDDRRGFATRGLVSGIARVDPQRATEYVLSLETIDEQRGQIGAIADELMKKGVGAVESWANGLPNDELKSEAMSSLGRAISQQGPEAAAEWAAKQASNDYASDAVGSVAANMVDRALRQGEDIGTALDWVSNLPTGASRTEAFEETFERWGREDPENASTYLRAMESGTEKDHAVSAFSDQITREDPEMAVQWASTISDEAVRNEQLQQSAAVWYRRDQEAAAQWLNTANLPDATVEQIINPPRRERGGPGGGGGGWGRGGGGGGGGRGFRGR